MTILGIETSCDETSVAVVEDKNILSNVVSSQIDLHTVYGGVVPEVASRQHLKMIDLIIIEALKRAGKTPQEVDAVAVTRGPGLPSALLVGVATARGLSLRLQKPLIPIHHLEAHLYSAVLNPEPFVALIVSGGHTLLIHSASAGKHCLLGQTLDDAAGEAFDKAAKLLGLPYPGGPAIEREAKKGDPKKYLFPRPMINSGDWNFSFSGLKTAVRRMVNSFSENPLSSQQVADLCASFQAAVVEVLVEKTFRAAHSLQAQQIAISGGVSCNTELRKEFDRRSKKDGIKLALADLTLCTDNAAMIALLAEKKILAGFVPPMDWDIEPDWALKS